jgi:hypothetical protein
VKELASRSGRTVEYRSGARICRESRLRRLAKEGPGSSLNQPKRNDAVVVNKSDAQRPAGQCPESTKAPKAAAGDFPEQARRLCAITRVSIHGLRTMIGDTEVSARRFRGAALGMWGRGINER